MCSKSLPPRATVTTFSNPCFISDNICGDRSWPSSVVSIDEVTQKEDLFVVKSLLGEQGLPPIANIIYFGAYFSLILVVTGGLYIPSPTV